MSNFICSECGMTNIDCGGDGYKTPKEIELEKENKRLQEQIKEAQNLIIYCSSGDHLGYQVFCEQYMHKYHLSKWGVK